MACPQSVDTINMSIFVQAIYEKTNAIENWGHYYKNSNS